MQTLAPWQRSPESSFQTFLITSRSEARAGRFFSFPLTTDKNTSHLLSQSVSKHALDFLAWCLMSNHACYMCARRL